jgi:hypothetical protein
MEGAITACQGEKVIGDKMNIAVLDFFCEDIYDQKKGKSTLPDYRITVMGQSSHHR